MSSYSFPPLVDQYTEDQDDLDELEGLLTTLNSETSNESSNPRFRNLTTLSVMTRAHVFWLLPRADSDGFKMLVEEYIHRWYINNTGLRADTDVQEIIKAIGDLVTDLFYYN